MKYKVIRDFSDSTDNNFVYRVGDVFPHSGKEVSENRIKDLLGTGNKQGVPLIKEDAPVPSPDVLIAEHDKNTVDVTEAKKKPRKGRRKNVRTDS